MVRTKVRQPAYLRQSELVAVEQVIQGPPHEPVVGMKRIEYTPSYAWIEKSTDFSEQAGCFRPGHIVQLTG